mgnify:CR=1 FL=1
MIDRATKLRLRRKARKQKKKLIGVGVEAEAGFEKLFVRRLARLTNVKRFLFSWVFLMLFALGGVMLQARSLSSYYLIEKPVPGGSFSEGVVGVFGNANPIFSTGAVDNAVSKLLFSGLMRHNQDNQLVGDLAKSIKSDELGQVYTVVLRDNLFWHDGEPVQSDDVLFTYGLIQNPDVRSPLFTSWSGVKISAVDERTIEFKLPDPLASFPYSLTNGIVPKHLLHEVEVTQLRSAPFNSISPIGSGPFKLRDVTADRTNPDDFTQTILFTSFDDYHLGQPKLERFSITTYRAEEEIVAALESKNIDAAAGIEAYSDDLQGDVLQQYNIPLTGQVGVFFKSSVRGLDDKQVRQALTMATDRDEIRQALTFPVLASESPFLRNHFTYNPNVTQLAYNQQKAIKTLEQAGWTLGEDGVRTKDKQRLSFRLLAQATSENHDISQHVQLQWRAIGVDLEVVLLDANDLQAKASNHDYDLLLYGISLGNDPDIFAYWHSSQAKPGAGAWLNFSEYSASIADEALESGRTRTDTQLRAIKYAPFLPQWRDDAPAVMLYQPRFLYIATRPIEGFEPEHINSASDRYSNVHNWMIRRRNVQKTVDDL